MAPHETGNIARLQGLELEFFAPRGGCVVRCLAYHARSFDLCKALQRQRRTACGP